MEHNNTGNYDINITYYIRSEITPLCLLANLIRVVLRLFSKTKLINKPQSLINIIRVKFNVKRVKTSNVPLFTPVISM